ncbi:uncharacterized protein CLUP02_02654 [Colletotrichum lupini]|uniref:Uncharacterized protein n=1 Tax=Colletotrichum lupini TaxID=145971 RepID=A0A9Q8SGX5_9PEZI|nr:uncharacterized protein CLUP02_02654 [Colletotrichum lupini]UQC77187.1 hypothetical protein CLUP02_02654 [Colletotrichum lupini]
MYQEEGSHFLDGELPVVRRLHYGSSMPPFSLLISPRWSTTWPRPLSWTLRQSFEYLINLSGFRFRRQFADDPAWV